MIIQSLLPFLGVAFQTWAPVIGPFTPVLPKDLNELQRERPPFTALMGNTKDEASPYSIKHFDLNTQSQIKYTFV